MDNFVFNNPTRIIFGKDTELSVGQEVKVTPIRFCFIMAEEALNEPGYVTGSLNP